MVKKGNSIILSTLICLLIAAAFISGIEAAYGAEKHHEPTRKSLKEHSIPKWLKDAKFGIYCHWKRPGREISPEFGKNFDAEEWAELFEKAGAQFAGLVAEHWIGLLIIITKSQEMLSRNDKHYFRNH